MGGKEVFLLQKMTDEKLSLQKTLIHTQNETALNAYCYREVQSKLMGNILDKWLCPCALIKD